MLILLSDWLHRDILRLVVMTWEIGGSKLAEIGRSGARVQERIVA